MLIGDELMQKTEDFTVFTDFTVSSDIVGRRIDLKRQLYNTAIVLLLRIRALAACGS